MKKFLTTLTVATIYSFSANAQDVTPTKVDPSFKASPEHKIATLKKKQHSSKKIADADKKSKRNRKETTRFAKTTTSNDEYADTNDEPTTLNSAPNPPISHTIKNF